MKRDRGKRPGLFVAVAGATVPLLAFAVAYVALRDGSDGGSDTVSLPPAGGVTSVAPIPASLPGTNVVQWTGSEVLVFGSTTNKGAGRNGAAAFTPDSGSWRDLPASPFSAPVSEPDGFWTGRDFIVGGILCDNQANPDDEERRCEPGEFAVASYSPERNEWRAFSSPPDVGLEPGDAGSWGTAVGEWQSRAVFVVNSQYWALSVDDGSWQRLPDAESTLACVIGESLLAFTPTYEPYPTGKDADPGLPATTGVSVEVLGPGAAQWEVSGQSINDPGTDYFDRVCTDTSLVAFTETLGTVLSFDPSSRAWTALPAAPVELATRPAPVDAQRQTKLPIEFQSRAWTGTGIAFWNTEFSMERPEGAEGGPDVAVWPGNAVVLDPKSGRWSAGEPGQPMPPDGHVAAWTDGFAFTTVSTGVGDQAEITLGTYRPA